MERFELKSSISLNRSRNTWKINCLVHSSLYKKSQWSDSGQGWTYPNESLFLFFLFIYLHWFILKNWSILESLEHASQEILFNQFFLQRTKFVLNLGGSILDTLNLVNGHAAYNKNRGTKGSLSIRKLLLSPSPFKLICFIW